MGYPLTLKLKCSIYSGSTINIQVSQKFLQSEKLQTEVSFSFITFNNILFLIITLFQAPEKVLFAEDTNRKFRSFQLYSLLGFSPVLKRFKIGVEVVFLDVDYILKIVVGTMVNVGLLVFNSTFKISGEIVFNSFSVGPTSSSECSRPCSGRSSGWIFRYNFKFYNLETYFNFILILSGCFTRIGLKFSSDE